MFNFLKKTLGGFVDKFKNKEDERLEQSEEGVIPQSADQEPSRRLPGTDDTPYDDDEPVIVQDDTASHPVSSSPKDAHEPFRTRTSIQDAKEESDHLASRTLNETIPADAESDDTQLSPDARTDTPSPDLLTPPPVASSPTRTERHKTARTISNAIDDRLTRKEEKRGLFAALTTKKLSDAEFDKIFEELEMALLENNTAYEAVEAIKEGVRERLTSERLSRFKPHERVKEALKESISSILLDHPPLLDQIAHKKPFIILFLGVNGTGKTTSIAKLAHLLKRAGHVPVLAASDTFRAAAIHQLDEHARALDVRIIKHDYGADPTAVAYDALTHANAGKADVVLIDTAGRLHSNTNLLREIEKIKRVIKPDLTFYVGESIAGNDLIEQATTFNDAIGIDGIILTKTDVDEKGGGALSVSYVTGAPIYYLMTGQGYEDIEEFDKDLILRTIGL